MRLKIRRLDPTIPLPSYGTDEADVDLAPAGHVLGIFARSRTPLKRGLLGPVRESGPAGQRWLVGSHSDPTAASASSIPIIPAQTTRS